MAQNEKPSKDLKSQNLTSKHCSEGICTHTDCDSCISVYESSMRLRVEQNVKSKL
jgi:hypothetical protein